MAYYSGDPGFWSGLKKLAGAAVGFIPGVGGVLSSVLSGTEKALAKHPTLTAAGGAAAGGAASGAAGALVQHMGSRGMHPAGTMPGGASTSLTRMGPALPMGGTARGYHMSKPRKGVPSHLVRNRRMRPTNPKALRRAIRRAKGFERLARKVMHFVSPRKTKGRAVFRVRRRSK